MAHVKNRLRLDPTVIINAIHITQSLRMQNEKQICLTNQFTDLNATLTINYYKLYKKSSVMDT